MEAYSEKVCNKNNIHTVLRQNVGIGELQGLKKKKRKAKLKRAPEKRKAKRAPEKWKAKKAPEKRKVKKHKHMLTKTE